MQSSNTPAKLVLPFAASGGKRTIPTASQVGVTPGAASLADGFPPLTRTPLSAGGVPPSGIDMNGILYEMSDVIRWANAGGGYAFDSTFATDSNVGGYPKGARVMRSDGLGYWINSIDNNTADPEGGTPTGWSPDTTTGAAAVTMTSANVTLSPLEYGRPTIVLSGTLSANLNLVFPSIVGEWVVINNCTGAFFVTCKTAAAAGIALPLGFKGKIVSDATSINTDDAVFIASGTGAVPRRMNDKAADIVSFLDFDTTANANAAAKGVVIPSGSYSVTADFTFTTPVSMLPGAVFNIATGVTLTFANGFSAGVYQVFACTGTGKVVFTWAKITHGYPEWWGAASGINSAPVAAANSIAFNAALVALPQVNAQGADYFYDSIINHKTPTVYFKGAGSKYDSVYGPHATRLILTTATGAGFRVGLSANPGSINMYPRGLRVSDICFTRLVAPNINTTGIAVSYATEAFVERVQSAESTFSWQFLGTNGCRVDDCTAIRSVAAVGGTDFWRAYYVDGVTDVIAAGGNASLYMNRCSAGCNLAALQTGNSTGFYIDGAFTDLFMSWPESAFCYRGIQIMGNSATGNTFSNTDLHIVHPIMDQFHNVGLYIANVAEAGSFVIDEPYLGPASDARASLWVINCPGGGRISGGQFVQGGAPSVQPVIIDTCGGVILDGTQILESGAVYPVIGTTTINSCLLTPKIKNKSVTAAAAIQLSGTCVANTIGPIIMGKASAFTFGVQVLGTADTNNEYRTSGINSACLVTSSANKLNRNGVAITATGLSGTNLVSGVMS